MILFYIWTSNTTGFYSITHCCEQIQRK